MNACERYRTGIYKLNDSLFITAFIFLKAHKSDQSNDSSVCDHAMCACMQYLKKFSNSSRRWFSNRCFEQLQNCFEYFLLHSLPLVHRILLVPQWNEIHWLNVPEVSLVSIVHYCEVFLVIVEWIQRKGSGKIIIVWIVSVWVTSNNCICSDWLAVKLMCCKTLIQFAV